MSDVILLPEELSLSKVNQLLEEIRKTISTEDKVILDAQYLKEMDALGLQLIISLKKTAQINNIKFELINANPDLMKFISMANI